MHLFRAVIPQLATRTDLEARHADGFPFVATATASESFSGRDEYFHLG
jgi:hypothetical protein